MDSYDAVTEGEFHGTAEPSGQPVVPHLGLETTHLGGAAILRVAGELGATSVPLFTASVEDLIDGTLTVIVVDLHDLTGVDAAGIRAVEQLSRRARDRGTALRIITNNPDVLMALTQRRGLVELDVHDTSGRFGRQRRGDGGTVPGRTVEP